MSPSLPWPTSGDELFCNDGSWPNAHVGWSLDQWDGYTEGYRRATEILLEHVLTQRADHNTLIYPIIFNARHYFELKLKYLFILACDLMNHSGDIPLKHPLARVWQELRPLLEQIFPGHDAGELTAVETIIREFDNHDATSMVFRYPVDSNNQLHLPTSFSINYRTFETTFMNISMFLECCDTAIQEYSRDRSGSW